jgi:hypothetical protein
MKTTITLKDLVNAIAADAENDAEVVATVVWMVNSGRVRLHGSLAGARFDLDTLPLHASAAA